MLPEIMNLLRKFYFMRAFARNARYKLSLSEGTGNCALFSYLYNRGFSVL